MKVISMRKIKEILRLKFEKELSQKQIAKSIKVAKSTVQLCCIPHTKFTKKRSLNLRK